MEMIKIFEAKNWGFNLAWSSNARRETNFIATSMDIDLRNESFEAADKISILFFTQMYRVGL